MLEFAQRPPQSSNDITLTESGAALLERSRSGDNKWDRLDTLGQAAFSEVVDALQGTSIETLEDGFLGAMGKIGLEARGILGDDIEAFFNGMNSARIRHPEEVSA